MQNYTMNCFLNLIKQRRIIMMIYNVSLFFKRIALKFKESTMICSYNTYYTKHTLKSFLMHQFISTISAPRWCIHIYLFSKLYHLVRRSTWINFSGFGGDVGRLLTGSGCTLCLDGDNFRSLPGDTRPSFSTFKFFVFNTSCLRNNSPILFLISLISSWELEKCHDKDYYS